MLNISYLSPSADFFHCLDVSTLRRFYLSSSCASRKNSLRSYPTPSSHFHTHLVAIVLRCEKIISNFSRAESPHRHRSSRQVTPVAAKSAFFPRTPLIPTPAFHHRCNNHYHNHHRHHRRRCRRRDRQHHHLRSSTTIYSDYHLLCEALAM